MPANASCLVHNQKEFLVLRNIVVARKMAFQFKNLQPLTVSSFIVADCINTAQRRRCWLYFNVFTELWCKVFKKLNWHFFPLNWQMLILLPQARQRQNSAQSWRNYTSNTQIISFYLPDYLLTIFLLRRLSNCNLKGTIFPISGGERTILRGSLACNLPLSTLLNTTCKDPCEFLTWSEVGENFWPVRFHLYADTCKHPNRAQFAR